MYKCLYANQPFYLVLYSLSAYSLCTILDKSCEVQLYTHVLRLSFVYKMTPTDRYFYAPKPTVILIGSEA